MHDTQALTTTVTGSKLDLAVSAWLHAHGKHFDADGNVVHTRTSGAYEYTLDLFRTGLRKRDLDLDSDPSEIALLAEVFAHGSVRKGKQVTKTTVNQRLACLSSFYQYARKKQFIVTDNPLDLVDREKKIQAYAHAEALHETVVQEALAAIDQTTPRGARDYAILSVLFQTARRAQEVATLTWRNVKLSEGKATLTFEHAKGDEVMLDTLPVKVTNALLRWLRKFYGSVEALSPDTPLWVSLAHDGSYGQPLGYQSINTLCKKHLDISKVHVTRHTAAHAMEQVGLSVSEIQARLGHKSLATTGRYLESLRRAENRKADELAAYYGIE